MIKTDRLTIRPIEHKDIESVRVLHNDPEILEWLSDPHIVSKHDQEIWFTKINASLTADRFVVELSESKDLVGVFRLDDIDLNNHSALIGLDIATKFRRTGMALETYEAVLPFLFETFKLNRLSLVTLSSNQPAISLYEKLGFIKEGILREAFYKNDKYINGVIYSKLKADI